MLRKAPLFVDIRRAAIFVGSTLNSETVNQISIGQSDRGFLGQTVSHRKKPSIRRFSVQSRAFALFSKPAESTFLSNRLIQAPGRVVPGPHVWSTDIDTDVRVNLFTACPKRSGNQTCEYRQAAWPRRAIKVQSKRNRQQIPRPGPATKSSGPSRRDGCFRHVGRLRPG
ncbi:hypothetical protein FHR87_001882 [Azomonas macrocytogenes]|uniref:Uncharacterized protein n=1 Tax=Azomonas macrocytogenes TaxID=69962 RepID=A0A839T4R5_AZOMA|nr:hypothetical protein [Azomonas macrocytogenes]